MAALNIKEPPIAKMLDDNGNLSLAWRQYFQEMARIAQDHEERIVALEP